MVLMQSDIESISQYVIWQFQAREMSLNEADRKRLIAIAIRTFMDHELAIMRETIAWEIELIAQKVNKPKLIDICAREHMRNQTAVEAYFAKIGAVLKQDSYGYWVAIMPRQLCISDVKARVRDIFKRG